MEPARISGGGLNMALLKVMICRLGCGTDFEPVALIPVSIIF
jgi:hypothetical protein